MTREEIAVAFRRCGTPSACGKQCPYYTKGLHCYQALREDVIRILEGDGEKCENPLDSLSEAELFEPMKHFQD